jgi:hypothetical protein
MLIRAFIVLYLFVLPLHGIASDQLINEDDQAAIFQEQEAGFVAATGNLVLAEQACAELKKSGPVESDCIKKLKPLVAKCRNSKSAVHAAPVNQSGEQGRSNLNQDVQACAAQAYTAEAAMTQGKTSKGKMSKGKMSKGKTSKGKKSKGKKRNK